VRLPTRYYRMKFRTINRLRDWWDREVRGLCCKPPKPGQGGYRFWRCGLERDHEGPHRFVNYTWTDDERGGGGVRYQPLENPPRGPKRYAT
jgi:hypothetical protein